MEDAFLHLYGKKNLSAFDCAGGYYQCGIARKDRDKTGMVLPSSCSGTMFRWTVACYGLTNVPAVYSRMVHRVLAGLEEVATHWVDDVLAFTETAEDHLTALRLIFERFAAARLCFKMQKAEIFAARLPLLGFIITPDGVAPDPDKVESLRNFGEPDDLNRIRCLDF